MTVKEYLNSLEPDRKTTISKLRDFIMKHDKNVKEAVEGMMGKEMIVYKVPCNLREQTHERHL